MKVAVLGASRGLGAALVHHLRNLTVENREAFSFLLASRKLEKLSTLASSNDLKLSADFTRFDDQNRIIEELGNFKPERIFYVAGGGPFGAYDQKEWKDHLWALELNLIFPARLIHSLLADSRHRETLQNITIVGSQVAGRGPDPQAAAYSAAKHGLVGLVSSLQKENHKIRITLFEPGYMDTEMLPPNAWPRQHGAVESPMAVARKLWSFSEF